MHTASNNGFLSIQYSKLSIYYYSAHNTYIEANINTRQRSPRSLTTTFYHKHGIKCIVWMSAKELSNIVPNNANRSRCKTFAFLRISLQLRKFSSKFLPVFPWNCAVNNSTALNKNRTHGWNISRKMPHYLISCFTNCNSISISWITWFIFTYKSLAKDGCPISLIDMETSNATSLFKFFH